MISVAMITMNEEGAVQQVIADIRAALGEREHEIVIVDSSKDRTPEIAEREGARVIRQFPPQGYGRAMGRVLKESRGDVIVTLDCDGTYPASEIPRMADMVLKGECDLVNASRLEKRPASMPWQITSPTGCSRSPGTFCSASSPPICIRGCARIAVKLLNKSSSIRTVRRCRWSCC